MPLPVAILSVLQSVTAGLISKGLPSAYEKVVSGRTLQADFESAWSEALQKTSGAFSALVDQEQLSKVVLEHALDPYWVRNPDRKQILDAGSLRWFGTEQAQKAAGEFVANFVESWKHMCSFKAQAQIFEQLRQTELLEQIRDAIVSVVRTGTKTSPSDAPPAAVLLEYCKRLQTQAMNRFLIDRSVTQRPDRTARAAPAVPVPFEEVLASNDRIIVLGEGGLGKTGLLRRREHDLAARYEAGTGSCVPVFLKMAEYRGGTLERLAAGGINDVLKGSRLRLAEAPEESERVIRTLLEEPGSIEILIDGLNETPETHLDKLRSELVGFLKYPQRFVLTSRDRDIDPLPGIQMPEFVLTPLNLEEIGRILVQTLSVAGAELQSRLASDTTLAVLLGNPFMLELVVQWMRSFPGETPPRNRALLMRASVSRVRQVLRREGRTAGAAERSGVIEEFLNALAWKMLRNGVVSARYTSVYAWNLPLSGLPLDDVLRGASAFRYLRSEGNDSELIEFRHPLFRDYFAAERISSRLEQGDDPGRATEEQYCAAGWHEPLQMTAGLCGSRAGDLVKWLVANNCTDLAWDCWADSEARNDPSAAASLAASLRASVTPDNIEYIDSIVEQLGELRDPHAVPIIIRFLAAVGSWARFEAIPALEKIASPEACQALVNALEDRDEDTARDASEALHRIGRDAVPALLRSSRSSAEKLLRELAPTAVAGLTHALQDQDKEIRARALYALGASNHAAAAGTIVPLLLYDDEILVRTQAAIALGKLHNPAAAEALEKASADENPGVRFEAASSLWEQGWAVDAARAELFRLYESQGHHAVWKVQILKCLMIKPDAEIVATLIQACRDTNDEVRRNAFALLNRVEENIDDLLSEGLGDKQNAVCLEAAAELFRRHGESALHWLARSFEENPSGRHSLLLFIDRRFADPGRDFLIRVLDSDLDENLRALAARQLSRHFNDGNASAALESALQKADPAIEPDLVAELSKGLRRIGEIESPTRVVPVRTTDA